MTPGGRITHRCTGIWDDGQIPGLAEIAHLYKSHGAAAGIQIGHSGRRGSCALPWEGAAHLTDESEQPGWQTVGPSALPERDGYPLPHALTEAEILDLVDAFAKAAVRAVKAGFDVIEIHGAHGYLIHSFLSPLSNQRTDRYGGTPDGRMAFPLLVSEAVRAV